GPGPGPGPGPAVRPPPRPRCPSRTSGHLLGARRAFAVPPVAGGGVVGADSARGDGAAVDDPRPAGGTAPVRSPRRHRARGRPADSRTPGAGASAPARADRAPRARAPARRDRRAPPPAAPTWAVPTARRSASSDLPVTGRGHAETGRTATPDDASGTRPASEPTSSTPTAQRSASTEVPVAGHRAVETDETRSASAL